MKLLCQCFELQPLIKNGVRRFTKHHFQDMPVMLPSQTNFSNKKPFLKRKRNYEELYRGVDEY